MLYWTIQNLIISIRKGVLMFIKFSKKRNLMTALVLAVVLTLLVAVVALADDVVNNADASVDAAYETVNITIGAPSRTVDLWINPQNGDGKSGCNLTGSTTLVINVTSSNPGIVTFTPAQMTFTNCEAKDTNLTTAVTVTPVAAGETNIEFSLESNNSAGTFNLDTARFTVKVSSPSDTTAPVIAAHANETAEATSAGVATCAPASGTQFSLGDTTVTCNATDAAGNAATPTTFVVHVVDTTPPVIAPHADETAEATSASGAVVSYTAPATSDAVDGAGVATCAPASGTQFALGNTIVTCNAADAAGNDAVATTFVVHVVDTTPPVIAAHADMTAEATSALGAIVSYTAPATSDAVDGAGTATCAPASGTQFALGNTIVTCNAADTAGNDAVATTFVVHVVDTTPPVIAAHADVTAEATSALGAIVNYTAPATSDAVDGAGVAICVPASGTQFALGNTTVTCNATDAHGNAATPTTFVIKVILKLYGFYQPVDMNGVYNMVKNGSTVPLKFEIFAGATELTDVLVVDSLTYAQTNCSATAITDDIETVATGQTVLRYDSTGGQFVYNWKTPSTAGKCYRVTMAADDGSSLVAYFKLK
jgi:hypothetical protein